MPEEEEVKRGKWTFAHLPALPSKFALKPIEKNEGAPEDAAEADQAQGRHRADQRLRRRARGRAHLPLHRPVREIGQADQAPVAAVDDAGGDPRRLRATAQRRDDAAAGRRRRVPLRVRLAGRHQRHAGDDRVQFQVRRLPADHGRPRADAHARDPGRARGEDPRVPRRATIGNCAARSARQAANTRAAGSTRNSGRSTTTPTPAPSGCGRRRPPARSPSSRPASPGIVTEESKPSTQGAPLLYDLTSLQREANGRFGFSARTTLSLAQALYEKHKVLTYPRTDARALPEDYIGTVKATMEELAETNAFGGFAREILKQKWVKPNKRIFDNSKISDHFAIIPTLARPKHLNEIETKLYDLVVRRFLAVFYPPAEFLLTTRITRVEAQPFKTEGKVLVSPGWLAVYGKEAQGDEATLVPVQAQRKRRDGKGRVVRARHARAAAPERGDAAVRHGRRGQADRGRRAARGDARKGPGHAGHARVDHRRPDRGALHLSRRQGARAHRQGVFADDAAARPGHPGTVLAGTHRRVGVQAGADGARQARPRRVHARDRRDDRAHRRAGQGLRERHDSRRLRDALQSVSRSAASAKCTRSTRNSSA